MYIIYHCRGGAHSSPVAAALHLGTIPMDKAPDATVLLKQVPVFDKTDSRSFGYLRFMGVDEMNHQIFIVGRRKAANILIPAVKDAVRLAGDNPDNYLFVNVMPAVNFWMKLGGFSSRGLRWVGFGRPIVIKGTQKAFPQIVEIVKRTKSALRTGELPQPTTEQKTTM